MSPVLKRIAVNGLLTAVVLGMVGVLFAELADLWLVGVNARTAAQNPNEPVKHALRNRLPLTMAGWGFGFVIVCELVMGLRRRMKSATPAEPRAVTPPAVDPAEALLEELLTKAETAISERETVVRTEAPAEAVANVADTPMPAATMSDTAASTA